MCRHTFSAREGEWESGGLVVIVHDAGFRASARITLPSPGSLSALTAPHAPGLPLPATYMVLIGEVM